MSQKGFVYSVSADTRGATNKVILHMKVLKEDSEETHKIGNTTVIVDNFFPNFYMKKPAFVPKEVFEEYLNELRDRFDIYWIVQKFKDGNWTDAVHEQEFYKIFGQYFNLYNAYSELKIYVTENVFPNIDTWSFLDEVDYNNTENPFRYSRFIYPNNWKYVLSTRHNISICGVNSFSKSSVNFEKPDEMKTIRRTFEDFDKYIKIMAYDIETYTPDNMSTDDEKHEIMCIGICFFMLSSPIPYRRICVITKPVEPAEEDFVEFTPNDPIQTEYISFKSERDMLEGFIKIIGEECPLITVGFNNYGFDDKFIYERLQRYYDDYAEEMLSDKFLRLFSYDNTAAFKAIDLKIDGIQQNDNRTFIGNRIFSVDVYKYMVKANPKLYTQQAKGNLNSMLSLNKIVSPWDNKTDVQKTGLTYRQMFLYWDANIHIRDIAYYCMNDAFCAGLLLIKMGLLQDKIKLGETSCSSLSDSLYKEVSEKVLTKIEEFGWANGFCLSDDTLGISRPSMKEF